MALTCIKRISDNEILGKYKEDGFMGSTWTGYISGCEYEDWRAEEDIPKDDKFKLCIFNSEEGANNWINNSDNPELYKTIQLFSIGDQNE